MPSSFTSAKPSLRSRAAFTLIELLIVIAIIAVLAVAVVLFLNPAEMLKRARDSNRLSDLKSLDQAITLYSEDVGGSLGTPSTTYVSIPDPTATSTLGDQCQGLGLPALPSGEMYHCAATSTYKNTDGTGWIPVNFKSLSFGSPLGTLPQDPVNTTSSGLYYTYTYGGGNNYGFTAPCESTKDQKGGACDKDGGISSLMDEVGTDPAFVPPAVIGRASTYAELTNEESALVGYWKFDEGTGSTAYDSSGNGNNGTWNGTPAGTSGYYSAGHNQTWAGYFDGSTDYSNVGTPGQLNGLQAPLAILGWFDTVSTSTYQALYGAYQSTSGGQLWSLARIDNGYLTYFASQNGCAGLQTAQIPSGSTNVWHFFAIVINGNLQASVVTMYVDSASTTASFGTMCSTPDLAVPIYIGGDKFGDRFHGLIDGLRAYNRALSASEIQAIYNSEK